MPADDEAEAVAVLLPAPEAARAAVSLWEAGEAVVPLDPSAPALQLRRSLATLRPTAGFDPAAVGQAALQGAAFVSLVPIMLRRLLETEPGAATGFARILLGGGSIDPALLARARAAGATVSTTYGMTETWGGIVHDGHPLPDVELRLDPTAAGGDGVEADGIGEILVRAPMLMRGYRLWPEETAAAVDADGWHRTGDLGRFDPATGRLWIVDRPGAVP